MDRRPVRNYCKPTAPFGDGTYQTGIDVAAGTWRASGGELCYWESSPASEGRLTNPFTNGLGEAATIVTIAPTDAGFSGNGCGEWTFIGG